MTARQFATASAETVIAVGVLWAHLDSDERRAIKRVSVDLYDALHRLVAEVNEPVEASEPGVVNGAPGVTGFVTPGTVGYPAEERVADLERFLAERNARESALHHARKSFRRDTEDPWTHARDVVTVAQVFEKYLIGNAKDEETAS